MLLYEYRDQSSRGCCYCCWCDCDQDKLWAARIAETDIQHDLDASLARLGVSHVDVYLLHRDDPAVPVRTIVEMMRKLVASGKVRAWGVSN